MTDARNMRKIIESIQKIDEEAGLETLKLFDEVLKKLGMEPDNA